MVKVLPMEAWEELGFCVKFLMREERSEILLFFSTKSSCCSCKIVTIIRISIAHRLIFPWPYYTQIMHQKIFSYQHKGDIWHPDRHHYPQMTIESRKKNFTASSSMTIDMTVLPFLVCVAYRVPSLIFGATPTTLVSLISKNRRTLRFTVPWYELTSAFCLSPAFNIYEPFASLN